MHFLIYDLYNIIPPKSISPFILIVSQLLDIFRMTVKLLSMTFKGSWLKSKYVIYENKEEKHIILI